MAAYVVGRVTVTDPSWIEEYGPAVEALMKAHGGRYVIRNTEMEKLEGDGELPTVVVVLEFPTLEAARAWYDDPQYAPWIKARQSGSVSELILVDGI